MSIPSVAPTCGGVWLYRRKSWSWSWVAGVVMIVAGVCMVAFMIVVALGFTATTKGEAY